MSNGSPTRDPRPPSTNSFAPAWGPPRAPLAPHRLAKLANALGVSTPIPALHPYTSFISNSPASSSSSFFPDSLPRRSPTPASASTSNLGSSYSQSTSKFLLHVVPPLHLPHDSSGPGDSDLTPPPSSASGYHAQFRRGTLIPMHATLHSQLGAIAKEYALPNTAGMILYLVSANPSRSPYTSPVSNHDPEDEDIPEPGPRLSEDIWKHLWARVTKAERDDDMSLPPRSPSASLLGLGGHSSPYLPQEGNGVSAWRPIPSRTKTVHPHPAYPTASSSSTLSDASELRSHSKSAPPSSSSMSQSDPGTPDTSPVGSSYAPKDGSLAEQLHLPGLHSSSLIPILAKVEFDIDRKKAGWYEPWLRSRRMNHAKRAGTQSSRKGAQSKDSHLEDVERGRKAPLGLKIVERMDIGSPVPRFLLTNEKSVDEGEDIYEKLSDHSSDETDQEDGDVTARASTFKSKEDEDPLSDVFGSDADTWADLHGEAALPQRIKNPNVVELALDGTSLAELPDQQADEHGTDVDDADEIQDIIAKVSKSSEPSTTSSASASQRRSTRSSGSRKPAPPPLVIRSANDTPGGGSPSASASRLAYLRESNNSEVLSVPSSEDTDSARSEKRDGGIFEDFDFGVEFEHMHPGPVDPNDPWSSQCMMKNELDVIEKKLAKFSPRPFKEEEIEGETRSAHSRLRSKSYHTTGTARKGDNGSALPALAHSPRSRSHDALKGRPVLPSGTIDGVWPAVPSSTSATRESANPPPPLPTSRVLPQLTVNGHTTPASKGYPRLPTTSSETTLHETEIRKRESESHGASYSALAAPANPRMQHISPVTRNDSSPIIPLSPDPFSRFSSHVDSPRNSRQSSGSVYWESGLTEQVSAPRAPLASVDEDVDPNTPSSSRFSADSIAEEESKVGSKLMSVVAIKKLWRKSAKTSISSQPPSPPPPTPTIESSRSSPHLHPSAGSQDYSASSSLRSSPQHSQTHLPGVQEHHTQRNAHSSPQPPPTRPKYPSLIPPGANVQELSVLNSTLPISRSSKLQYIPPSQSFRTKQPPLDGLYSDHDSRYPVRNSSQDFQRPHDSSREQAYQAQQPSLSSPPRVSVAPLTPVSPLTQPRTPPPIPVIQPEKEKNATRKSILKSWKSSNNDSIDKRASGTSTTKYRRSNTVNSAGRESLEVPRGPAIPGRSNGYVNTPARLTPSLSEPMTTKTQPLRPSMPSSQIAGTEGTTVSPPRSRRSISSSQSIDSAQTRPSFDASQFEMVSPKNRTLTYPYHTLDNE